MARIIQILVAGIVLMTALPARADYLGVGLHAGIQHDTGNLSSYSSDIKVFPQNSLLFGAAFRVNMSCLFIRSGVDYSMMINKGEVIDSSANFETYKISYVSVPSFIGLSFPVQNTGSLYIGGGIAYFLGSGRIYSTLTNQTEKIEVSGLAYGVTTGIQVNATDSVRIYLEWQYLAGKSDPKLRTSSTYDWKELYVDFTGHRLLIGAMYYLI